MLRLIYGWIEALTLLVTAIVAGIGDMLVGLFAVLSMIFLLAVMAWVFLVFLGILL